jgi:hypothetical protein
MAQDHRQHIFEPFYTPRGGKRTRLGLVLCGIIRQHQVSSPVTVRLKHTTFNVYFPAIEDMGPGVEMTESCPHSERNDSLVDDKTAVLTSVSAFSTRPDASSGSQRDQALDLFKQGKAN